MDEIEKVLEKEISSLFDFEGPSETEYKPEKLLER